MALYIPHSIFHLAWLLYVRPETFGPYYVRTANRTRQAECFMASCCLRVARKHSIKASICRDRIGYLHHHHYHYHHHHHHRRRRRPHHHHHHRHHHHRHHHQHRHRHQHQQQKHHHHHHYHHCHRFIVLTSQSSNMCQFYFIFTILRNVMTAPCRVLRPVITFNM